MRKLQLLRVVEGLPYRHFLKPDHLLSLECRDKNIRRLMCAVSLSCSRDNSASALDFSVMFSHHHMSYRTFWVFSCIDTFASWFIYDIEYTDLYVQVDKNIRKEVLIAQLLRRFDKSNGPIKATSITMYYWLYFILEYICTATFLDTGLPVETWVISGAEYKKFIKLFRKWGTM